MVITVYIQYKYILLLLYLWLITHLSTVLFYTITVCSCFTMILQCTLLVSNITPNTAVLLVTTVYYLIVWLTNTIPITISLYFIIILWCLNVWFTYSIPSIFFDPTYLTSLYPSLWVISPTEADASPLCIITHPLCNWKAAFWKHPVIRISLFCKKEKRDNVAVIIFVVKLKSYPQSKWRNKEGSNPSVTIRRVMYSTFDSRNLSQTHIVNSRRWKCSVINYLYKIVSRQEVHVSSWQ